MLDPTVKRQVKLSQASASEASAKPQAYRLPRHFSLLLHECSRSRRSVLDNALKHVGITRTQTMLLATLSNFGIGTNQRDLSLALNSSTENVGAMLNLLEENDFVRRTSNARDKRSKTLTISEKGYAALDEAAAVAAKLEKKILAGIDRNELRVAEKVLVQVQLNLAEIAKLTS